MDRETLKQKIADVLYDEEVYKGLGRAEAILSAIAEAGCVIVPKEPTPDMSVKGFSVNEAEHDPAGVYRAMLSASPFRQEE